MENQRLERLDQIWRRAKAVKTEIVELEGAEGVLVQNKLVGEGEWKVFYEDQERRERLVSEFFEEDIPWLLEKAKGA